MTGKFTVRWRVLHLTVLVVLLIADCGAIARLATLRI